MTDPIRPGTANVQTHQTHEAASDPQASEAAGAPSECDAELVNLGRAGVAVTGSVAALVAATPTVVGVLPGIAAFVGASIYTGQAVANYLNCQDEAAKVK